jgi:hypothetical protein
MSRAKSSRKPCDVQQARQRLVDARQFLEAAELLDAPDVVATCAIHAASSSSARAVRSGSRLVMPFIVSK